MSRVKFWASAFVLSYLRSLAQLAVGKTAVIKTVGGEGALRLRFLDMGLIPKTKVKVQKVAPMGDPIQLLIRGYELTVRRDDAEKIEIDEEQTNI